MSPVFWLPEFKLGAVRRYDPTIPHSKKVSFYWDEACCARFLPVNQPPPEVETQEEAL